MTGQTPPQDSESVSPDDAIQPITAVKLLLFLVWWFSGIGVGTALLSPAVIGTAISATQFLVIILAFFCSGLLILTLIPGRDDAFAQTRQGP